MKIRDVSSANVNLPTRVEGEEKITRQLPAASFHAKMTSLSQDAHMKYMNDLVERITAQGLLVAKRADIKELQRYREMISELINETVGNAYAFSKGGTFDARGRHKVFALVKKVNEKLDALTQELLKNEAENLNLLDMVDDINGLLLDMMM